MSRPVTYDKQTVDCPNPLVRFSHRARINKSLEIVDAYLPKKGKILDFGAGPGLFLHRLGAIRDDAELVALEPFMDVVYRNITLIKTFDKNQKNKYSLITAFEVLEHLDDKIVESFLINAYDNLEKNGKLIISVPVMYGALLPIKEASRSVLHLERSEYSAQELIKSFLGINVERSDNALHSHKGFDFRLLENKIKNLYNIDKKFCSPFSSLPWWLNSQQFFIASKK